MKKVLLLLMFPIIGFSQYTSIPDKVFEETLIDLEYDTVFDGKVLTANIIGPEFQTFRNARMGLRMSCRLRSLSRRNLD